MDPDLRTHLDAHLRQLDALVARGRSLSTQLAADAAHAAALASMRVWQQDCAAVVNQLSGGMKSHWLSRAYSDAFLVRSTTGAAPSDIVTRIVRVLEQAIASLGLVKNQAKAWSHEGGGTRSHEGGGTRSHEEGSAVVGDENAVVGPSFSLVTPRRFGFVHNTELRPVLEQAYVESREAMEEKDYERALKTACGVMEAIVTDALEHSGLPRVEISGWSFDQRLTAAQAERLIRGGTARLPDAARRYREAPDTDVTERDARVTQQVLHVLMRDLDPGR